VAGSAAFTLTATGSNFAITSVVRWNGSNRTTTFVSSTQLQAQITAADIATAGTASVTVFTPTPGGGTSVVRTFTINNPAPTLSSMAPSTAAVGSGAFTLTVTGTNYVASSVVRWKNSNRTTTFISSTQLQAQILASDLAATGTAAVTVRNPTPGGGTSSSLTFTITATNPVPALSSIAPTSAAAGGAAFTLTATGTNFAITSVVRWNGGNRTTTFVSSTQLQAQIAAADIATAGTASVTVFTPTPGGGTSAAQTFTINNPAPTLSSIAPTSAVVGGAAFTLTATGTNFGTASVVRWNGSNRTTTYVSSTQLEAQITAADIATAGTASVTVFTPTPGGGTSAAQTFAIDNPAPTLSSIAPTSAAAGGGAFTLTATGTSFIASSVVRWNGSDRSTTFVSGTELQAAIPASDIAAAGSVAVTVFTPTPGGGSSSAQTFTITAPNPSPTLSSLSPNTAVAGGAAFTLTVTGTSFVGASVVRWNGGDRTTTFVSSTELQAQIAAADIAAAGTASVTVFNPAPGGGTSNTGTFSVTAGPAGSAINYVYDRLGRLVGVVDQQGHAATYAYDAVGNLLAINRIDAVGSVAITLVHENQGPAGTTVQIFGRGFSTTASQNTVTFNGTAAVVTDATGNRLVTSVPSGASTGSISVTSPSGTGVSPSSFSVVNVMGPLAVAPSVALVVPGRTQAFAATLNGTPTTAVNWAVNGIPGGAPHIGTISTAGVYTAPTPSGSAQSATVTATHVDDSSMTASASVVVVVPRPLVAAASMQTAPLLTGLSPATGTPGSVALSITLQGVGFVGTTEVALLRNNAADANVTVTGFTVVSDTEMTVTVDIAVGAATGALVVKVTTSSGASTPLGIAGRNVFTVQ
jgi:YD repeat-containing protein